MLKKVRQWLLFGFLFFVLIGGCGPGEIVSVDNLRSRFSTFPDLSRSLLPQLDLAAGLQQSSSIRYPFCIYTEDIPHNVQTENEVLSWSTIAMNTWIEPLVGQPDWKVKHAEAYRVEPGSAGCPSSHNGLRVYVIRINDMDGANNSVASLRMNMGNWGVHKLVVLHEMGHGLGLADTYSWEGREPIGQPSSTMNNVWVLGGVLQQDDIDAIRFVWARIRGDQNPCPAGYVVGEINGKKIWNEVFCVLDEDGGGAVALYQAEDFTNKSGCRFATSHAGYSGTGFMDYGGNGSWIEWKNVNTGVSGKYKMTFRFAVGTGQRESAIFVNNNRVGTVGFANTGSWASWKVDSITVSLSQGINSIRVVANTNNGGPNLDRMEIKLSGNSEIDPGRLCSTAAERSQAMLSCPSGETIETIEFAGYGLPSGNCDAGYTVGTCHAPDSLSVVKDLCLNQQSCSVDAANYLFGDPCVGVVKKIAVVYTCSQNTTFGPKDLVGDYSRLPIDNDWHKVNVTFDGSRLWWNNAAGVTWSLTLVDGELQTDTDCPYGKQKVSVERSAGDNAITGLRFGGEVYHRQ